MFGLRAKIWKHKRRFSKDNKGVTAIEFALLAPIFFPLLLSIVELGYLYTKITMIDHAVAVASKDIYIGAATAGSVTYDDIEDSICNNYLLGGDDCQENLLVELTEITSISSLPTTGAECQDSDLAINPTVNYDTGGSSSTVYMRACFLTEIMIPGLGLGLSLPKTATGKFAIISATAFVNEPF